MKNSPTPHYHFPLNKYLKLFLSVSLYNSEMGADIAMWERMEQIRGLKYEYSIKPLSTVVPYRKPYAHPPYGTFRCNA